MSRAYRIRVRESVNRVVRASDHVSTQLEVLGILPQDQMAELLAQELVRRGFERKANVLSRVEDGVTISVDVATGTVTVRAETETEIELEGLRQGRGDSDWTAAQKAMAEENLRKEVKQELDKQFDKRKQVLQEQATNRLEGVLGDVRRELDEAVNRVTAEALKQRAAQIGQIKELTEDPATGSLTIVVEV